VVIVKAAGDVCWEPFEGNRRCKPSAVVAHMRLALSWGHPGASCTTEAASVARAPAPWDVSSFEAERLGMPCSASNPELPSVRTPTCCAAAAPLSGTHKPDARRFSTPASGRHRGPPERETPPDQVAMWFWPTTRPSHEPATSAVPISSDDLWAWETRQRCLFAAEEETLQTYGATRRRSCPLSPVASRDASWPPSIPVRALTHALQRKPAPPAPPETCGARHTRRWLHIFPAQGSRA
jgi:hypothetical protein